jgi:hypothetical protein
MNNYGTNFNQNLYINGGLVSGINNLNLRFDTNIEPSLTIDGSGLNYITAQPIRGNLDVSLYAGQNDIFIQYTGANIFSGRIEYNDKYFNFYTGCLTDYSLTYKENEPLVSRAACVLYGEVGRITGNYVYTPRSYALPIYNFNYIDVNLDDIVNNRTKSFNLSISSQRFEKYEIGDFLPSEIKLSYPIIINLDLSLEINNFVLNDIRETIANKSIKNVDFTFRSLTGNRILRTLSLKDLVPINENLSLTQGDLSSIDISYRTAIISGEIS